ncbi:hypothetical protein [Deinococcus malanensis]|uniref:hypothetical protein n=1 Tax=Deinococcus malanensis TaxID=1706855 RepID=UPI00166DF1DA|nr:hypothetical protein [Deinococcus malanensis]
MKVPEKLFERIMQWFVKNVWPPVQEKIWPRIQQQIEDIIVPVISKKIEQYLMT